METLLNTIYKTMTVKYNMQAENLFRMYDYKDTGLMTESDFRRIMSIMFSEVINKTTDLDLLLRLAPRVAGGEDKINYLDLCKFLDKRFVRSFKYVQESGQNNTEEDMAMDAAQSHRNKSAVEIELERPLSKEASLNYILRKSAELGIDLRKEFVSNDPLELSVLPRVKMWGILINLPVGLDDSELKEVFENDLNFDNYGNCDYTGILNSDIFVTLEAKRLRERALKISQSLRKAKFGDGEDLDAAV